MVELGGCEVHGFEGWEAGAGDDFGEGVDEVGLGEVRVDRGGRCMHGG